MSYVRQDRDVLDYAPCRYGASKLVFRGPMRDLAPPYVAVIGGSETYGRFVERPYPALVEEATGLRLVNLGFVNAGPDVFLGDPVVQDLCCNAAVTVVQVMGAQNTTNRFYAVHPRRNDRFLRASPALKARFPEVDFTEFNFTRHLLATLHEVGPDRFAEVVTEIRQAWVARMRHLLATARGRRILLWVADHGPDAAEEAGVLWSDPLFVTRSMIEDLRPSVATVVEVVASPEARAQGTSGMVFQPVDEAAAASTPGIAVHREVAARLSEVLGSILPK